jgi:hypothetical protein
MNPYRTKFEKIEIISLVSILTLVFLPAAIHPAASATQTQTGMMIPLYAYPTNPSWRGLIQAKQAYPNVPVVAIIDPTSSGPGSYPDPNFASGIKSLQAAGITVVGYIDTLYGARSTSTVDAWALDYANWYHVNGIFFDEMSNTYGLQSYYSAVASYANSIGLSFTVGNPGTNTLPSYVGTVSAMVIYENPGYPSVSSIRSAGMGYSNTNFAMMAIGVGAPSQSYVSGVAQYVSWFYATDASGGNPYNVLPSYIGSEMSILSSMDSSTTTTTTTTTTTSTSSTSGAQITVVSQNTLGNTVSGYYTELYSSSGGVLGTGYTPSTYTLSAGVKYQVESDGYGPCTFSHWSGGGVTGSTQDPVSISVSAPTTITAVYSGSSCGSQTSTTTTSTTSTSTTTTKTTTTTSSTSTGSPSFNVVSVDQNGNPISGYWTVLYSSGGRQISAGYTPSTFTAVTTGTSYQVELDGYAGCTFSYWQDSGSSADPRTVVANGPTTLTGVYNCTSVASLGQPAFAALAFSAIAGEFVLPLTLVLAATGIFAISRTAVLSSIVSASLRRW